MEIEEFCNDIDSKFSITTHDGKFEGVLKFISVAKGRLMFDHVFKLPTRDYLGTIHILLSSISSWQVLESAENHVDIANFNSLREVLNGVFDKRERIEKADHVELPSGNNFFDYLPSYLKIRCPNDYCIIDSLSSDFSAAIEHLSNSSILGVSFDGPKICRSGNLSWVCISSVNCIFLFDIEKLGKTAFEKGLKGIFDNNEIEKVIHDCRGVADCLFHIYDTELKYVFDTQVADYLINMQLCNGKQIFKSVDSLNSCLFKYLKVPQQFLYNRNKCVLLDDEIKFFQKRPISGDFVNVLLKNSMYMLLLKEKQVKLLLSPFEQAVDLYLNSVRNLTDTRVHMLPSEFSNLAPACLLDCVKPVRFVDLPQPPDDTLSKMRSTLHGQKAWQRWKRLHALSEDSEND